MIFVRYLLFLDIYQIVTNLHIQTLLGPGPNRPRRDPGGLQQRAVYNGWKREHCFKNQTIEFPDGICGPQYGASSGRHNDLWSLRESGISAAFDIVQREPQTPEGIPKPIQYKKYGDGIYINGPHLRSRHVGDNLPLHLRQENAGMSSVREAVEWSYGEVKQLFPFLREKEKMKLTNMPISDIFFTCLLLRNCYNCLYESKTSLHFNCSPPTLEEYMI